jgi:hypothetical protein
MEKKLTGKRKQIDKSKTQMFGIIVAASIISVGCLVTAKSLFSQANYVNKVAGVKEKAVSQLKKNKDAVAKLDESYKIFANQNPNLLGGSTTGTGPRDGDNGKLVLDALPSAYDYPALITSLDGLFSKYKVGGLGGSDTSGDIVDDTATQASSPVEMPFTASVTASYTEFQQLLKDLDHSIRPIQLGMLSVGGKQDQLSVSLTATTYYQPETGPKVETKVVK